MTSDSDIALTGIVDADGALGRAGTIAITAAGGNVTQAAGSRLLTTGATIGATTGAVTLDRNNDVQAFSAPAVNGPWCW